MQITTYNYKHIKEIEDFKRIYKEEKEKNNIKECYYQVYYNGCEMITFNNFDDCLIYIKDDYNNTKEEFFTELENYSIGLLLYTKPVNYKGIVYDYDYDINFSDILI
jgi:hypothetical protein